LVDIYAKYITSFKILTVSEFGQQIIKKKLQNLTKTRPMGDGRNEANSSF